MLVCIHTNTRTKTHTHRCRCLHTNVHMRTCVRAHTHTHTCPQLQVGSLHDLSWDSLPQRQLCSISSEHGGHFPIAQNKHVNN